MGKKGAGEKTPGNFRIKLTAVQKRNGKAVAQLRGMMVREFWEEAMEIHLEEREAAEEAGDEFVYEVVPRDAENIVIYADVKLEMEVDEWAEADNVPTVTALYTALVRHIRRETKKLGFDQLDI